MAAFPSFDQRRPERDRGISTIALLTLVVASALTGAVVAFVVQRYLQRHQYIDILPSPAPTPRLDEPQAAEDTARDATVAPDLAESTVAPSADGASPLEAVSAGLSATRTAELGHLVETDVVAGDGSSACPVGFPIKGNGRSGIYHSPGALAYDQTRPTLCFRTTEAADRAGFRPAMR
jgi:hypothetical protein